MATSNASQVRRVASSHQAAQPVINRHVWDIVTKPNGDLVKIGELPAGHRICGELCSALVNAAAPAMNIDVYVDTAGQLLFNDLAIAGGAYARTALTLFTNLETIGVSDVNRDIYVLLNDGPDADGGQLIVQVASYPPAN